jgi:hypothetical protein
MSKWLSPARAEAMIALLESTKRPRDAVASSDKSPAPATPVN